MAAQHYEDYNDLIIKMEIEFLKFYHYLIIDGLRMSSLELNLCFLKRVKGAYCKSSLRNGLSDVSFECAGMRSAYIFSYGPLFTGSVAHHFFNFMHWNPWLLKKAIDNKSITITCLGGGPGLEILAIAKSMEYNLKMFCLNTKPITIYANVIDIDPGWKETVKLITQNWWKFLDTKYVRLRLSFIQFDLTQSLTDEVQITVKKSDLITMVNFVSAVYGTKCREKISEMLKEIINHVDENGVIFYVNCSRFACVKELSDIIATSADTEVIYGPVYNHTYQLSEPCLSECYRLYARHFADYPPSPQSKNHVVAWRKIEKH